MTEREKLIRMVIEADPEKLQALTRIANYIETESFAGGTEELIAEYGRRCNND